MSLKNKIQILEKPLTPSVTKNTSITFCYFSLLSPLTICVADSTYTSLHQDGDILASSFPVDTQVAYILSLGVVKEFRKHGIGERWRLSYLFLQTVWTVFKQFVWSLIFLSLFAGSLLLDSLKEHISTTAQDHCKAIYLHVLTTNNTAIHFYENRDFKQHHYLPYYYSIRGVLKDGFTYVLYINGGHPPWTILYPFQINAALMLISYKKSTNPKLLNSCVYSQMSNSVPWLTQHWLYSSYRFGTGQSEPMLNSSENLPASTESAAQFSAVVGHLVQERHWVQ